MREIAVIGAGYVGLATAVTLSRWGHHVRCFEKNSERLHQLSAGHCPLAEPDLEQALHQEFGSGRLRFACDIDVRNADITFICVGTPPTAEGGVNLNDLQEATAAIGETLPTGALVVVKSTVPVGTCESIERMLMETAGHSRFHVLSNPEFLRQGRALADAERPNRIVIGARDSAPALTLAAIYAPSGAPVHFCHLRTAELIKYAANAFLATKVSFINEIAAIAERVGADVSVVADAIGADERIGRQFLDAGVGFGGSCLPKDVRALTQTARENNCRSGLLEAVIEVNHHQKRRFLRRMDDTLGGVNGKTVAVLGASFKPNTADIRGSVALEVIRALEAAGSHLQIYDPAAMPELGRLLTNGAFLCADAYEAVSGADALVLLTEWPEFARLDWARVRELMRWPNIFDGRNLFDPHHLRSFGFHYYGVGRSEGERTGASLGPSN